jgi:predicted helicase
MKISWSQITPKEFEQLCYLILEANEFTDIQWYGESGGDKGRDIVAKETEAPLLSNKRDAKWVVQCKRYVSKPPKKEDINSFLISAREHRPNYVLIMITNTLSSNTKDWLESVRQDYSFEIFYWEEQALEREIANHIRLILERFPKISKIYKSDPVDFQEIITKREYVFNCWQFEEIKLVVINKSRTQAREEVIEFIKFLKQNRIDFTWQQKKKRRT